MRDDPDPAVPTDPRDVELARRHGVPIGAVAHLRAAMRRGGGTMAQFDHSAFGGPGQWMAGGLTMVAGGLDDLAGAARVDALCRAVAASMAGTGHAAAAAPAGASTTPAATDVPGRSTSDAAPASTRPAPGPPPSTSALPSFVPMPPLPPVAPMSPMSPMTPTPALASDRWWPADLGDPASIGAQDGMRYAHFPALDRLAVESAGAVVVFDTGGRRVAGFGQQRPGRPSIRVDGPDGPIDVASLPVVRRTWATPPA